jgi:nucleotide-binding universal stress UspA family protein
MIKTIVVGFDESEGSLHAFRHALETARRFAAKVILVSVIRVPEPAIAPEVEGIIDTNSRRLVKAMEGLIAETGAAGVEVNTEIVVGHPAEQIVHLAEVNDADLIVLGSGGAGRIKHFMLGSVSERVMRYASCPVTVVR